MNCEKNELSALTRLFSATVFREIGRTSRSPLFSRLIEQSSIASQIDSSATVGDAFEQAFSVLKMSGYRDEYVYRSALAQKIVLGRHSLNTASILNEVRAGQCKADVVVLNGTSTAYEIKSERDTLNRLNNQLENYSQVFAEVNVVVSPVHVHEVLLSTPEEVGVIVLSRRFTLQTVRAAKNRPERTSPLAALETMRASEAVSVLRSLEIEVPEVPNTQLRGELRKLFVDLDPSRLHHQMVDTLKQSRSKSAMAEFVYSIPKSLRAAALSTSMTKSDRDRVRVAVDTPLNVAYAWK